MLPKNMGKPGRYKHVCNYTAHRISLDSPSKFYGFLP